MVKLIGSRGAAIQVHGGCFHGEGGQSRWRSGEHRLMLCGVVLCVRVSGYVSTHMYPICVRPKHFG